MTDPTPTRPAGLKRYQFNVLLTLAVGYFTIACWFIDSPRPPSNLERAPILGWHPLAQEILVLVHWVIIVFLGTVILWGVWNRVLADVFECRVARLPSSVILAPVAHPEDSAQLVTSRVTRVSETTK